MDSGLATPAGEAVADPFEDFNSVTLHHDGEDHGHHMIDDRVPSPNGRRS